MFELPKIKCNEPELQSIARKGWKFKNMCHNCPKHINETNPDINGNDITKENIPIEMTVCLIWNDSSEINHLLGTYFENDIWFLASVQSINHCFLLLAKINHLKALILFIRLYLLCCHAHSTWDAKISFKKYMISIVIIDWKLSSSIHTQKQNQNWNTIPLLSVLLLPLLSKASGSFLFNASFDCPCCAAEWQKILCRLFFIDIGALNPLYRCVMGHSPIENSLSENLPFTFVTGNITDTDQQRHYRLPWAALLWEFKSHKFALQDWWMWNIIKIGFWF